MLHFTEAEYAARREATCREMTRRGLDGLLIFRQETMYYLTGYDTFGYVFFQCLHLAPDGSIVLLTRRPDREQARLTSVIEDVRVWVDGADANPALDLRAILTERGCAGARLGVEYDSYGLTGRSQMRLAAALDGFAALEDASDLVSRLRLVKSPAELAYVRRAAELADDALDAAHGLAAPGADESEILAAMYGAIYRGGGDDAGNPIIIGSGDHALLCRTHSGRRRLDAVDQLTIEFAGAYRHYHACLMRTICIGRAGDLHRRYHSVALDAMAAVVDAFRVGHTVGDAYAAHARVFDAAGLSGARMNACGYSLGAVFEPNWMDVPMIYAGEPTPIEPGQVFFLHMILADPATNTAMCPGQTILTTASDPEILSRHPLDLVVRS